MKTKHGLFFSWAVRAAVVAFVAAIFSFTLLGCSDEDPGPGPSGGHLVGGTIGSGATAKPFYADKTGVSRSARAAIAAEELEGKIEDGDFAITLKGTYDETSGKFALAAMSQTLGIGYSIEGFIKADGPRDVKAVVKAKGTDGNWTETEVAVQFDNETQVSETVESDAGAPGLPDAWTGLYPLPATEKTQMAESIDAMFFGASEDGPNGTGLGVNLVDSIFFSVTPWGLSLTTDFDGIDRGIDQFIAAQNPPGMTAANIAMAKKAIHMTLSQMLAGFYFSFLEVEKDPGSETRYALAFIIVTGGGPTEANPDALPSEKKYYTRFKITFANNSLKMVRVNGLRVDETESVPLLGYDEEGNIIPALDTNGQPMMAECHFTAEGVAATAAEARAATNFTEVTEGENINVVILTK